MRYTAPVYYKEFHCIASACPATCCAIWQIVVDQKSLKKYQKISGPFGNRIKNSIDWKEGTITQYQKRCSFLNEENLCDMYMEAGPDYLCQTCKKYPRHIEEFENERELSLSLSCPVVAELILSRKEKVRFLKKEDDRKEKDDETFDFFLYSALQDAREAMFEIMWNRELPISFRMAKVLAMANDVQNRVSGRRIFEIGNVIHRYTQSDADEILQKKFHNFRSSEGVMGKQKLLELLYKFEVLDESWPKQVEEYSRILYQNGIEGYRQYINQWKTQWIDEEPWMDIESEQLMIYFLYTYFCGAVYDGEVLSKVKTAIVSTLIIRELEIACQIGWGKNIRLFDRARIAWRFSREWEHSDWNLNKMDELMKKEPAVEFNQLLRYVLSDK